MNILLNNINCLTISEIIMYPKLYTIARINIHHELLLDVKVFNDNELDNYFIKTANNKQTKNRKRMFNLEYQMPYST